MNSSKGSGGGWKLLERSKPVPDETSYGITQCGTANSSDAIMLPIPDVDESSETRISLALDNRSGTSQAGLTVDTRRGELEGY